ncbi:MAG: NnrS family protein [Sulfurovum sp.]|nr:NnrS family protein [Sulfurovum sp.]
MHMQFSEEAESHYFFSQPHQPFFVLAFINAIVTMLIFMLTYKGVMHLGIPASNFHSYSMLYLLFTPAFVAFLFTTFPRFTSTEPIAKRRYMQVFSLYYIGSVLFVLGSIVSPILSHIGMFLLFGAHTIVFSILREIYKKSALSDNQDVFWILTAMGFGLFSHFIFILGSLFYAPMIGLATETGVYLYLFLLTFSVAQRMVPFFSHCMTQKHPMLLRQIFILLMAHVILEGIYTNSSFIADLALAYIIGKEIIRWQLPFPNPNPLLWILHLALYWIPVALIFGAMANLTTLIAGTNFLFLDIHVLILGFVFTILIGFGTRVTLGHSGNMMQAGTWEKVLFNWTQLVVVMRIFVSLAAAFGWNFMILFDISATVWMLMFILWAVRFFAVLINGKKLS